MKYNDMIIEGLGLCQDHIEESQEITYSQNINIPRIEIEDDIDNITFIKKMKEFMAGEYNRNDEAERRYKEAERRYNEAERRYNDIKIKHNEAERRHIQSEIRHNETSCKLRLGTEEINKLKLKVSELEKRERARCIRELIKYFLNILKTIFPINAEDKKDKSDTYNFTKLKSLPFLNEKLGDNTSKTTWTLIKLLIDIKSSCNDVIHKIDDPINLNDFMIVLKKDFSIKIKGQEKSIFNILKFLNDGNEIANLNNYSLNHIARVYNKLKIEYFSNETFNSDLEKDIYGIN